MRVIGVDPGIDGAVAVWDGSALVVFEPPVVKARGRGREINWPVFMDSFDVLCAGADHAFVELVGARPGNGVAGMFKFGYTAGAVRGILAALRVPVTMVTPVTWKKNMSVGAAKDSAVARACELFPDRPGMFYGPKGGKKDGVAEAALIAWYGLNKLMKEKTA